MARLKVKVGGTELGERHIYAFESAYQINEIPYLTLSIRDGDIGLETFERADMEDFSPGKDITLSGGVEDAEHLLFSGVVTHSCVAIEGGNTQLTLRAKGQAVGLLEHPVNFISNKEIDDVSLIKKVAALSRAYGFKDLSSLAKNNIKHAQFAAYQQTPWRIIFARMIENGAVFCPTPQGDSLIQLAEHQPEDSGEPFALRRVHACHMQVDTQSIIKDISTNAWDLKTQTLIDAKAAKKGAFKVWDKAESVLSRQALSLAMAEPLSKPQLQARAQAEASYRALDLCQGLLTVTQDSLQDVVKLKLLNTLKVKGVGEKFAQQNWISGIRHRFTSTDWFIDIELGLPLSKSLHSDCACLPQMQATMATVAPFKAYDKLPHTLPVLIPAIDKATPLYARFLTPFAGKKEGFFFQPGKGEEVMVVFLGGNASYPMIVGACHNAINLPPFDYDDKRLKRGLFVVLEQEKMSLLVDDENKEMVLNVTKDSPVTVALSTESVVLTSKAKQTMTLVDGTKFAGDHDVDIQTKGNMKVAADGKVEIKATATEIK